MCCPDEAPENCDDSSWEWAGGDPGDAMWYGCCTGDLTTVVYCGGGGDQYRNIDCTEDGETCGLTLCSGDDCMDCDTF